MEYQKQREFLRGKFEAGQLSHAYLFSGPEEVNMMAFAKEFVVLLNKSIARSDLAINKEQFPDLLVVKSINSKSSLDNQKDMMELDVAQIREVNNFLSLKSYYGGYKAVIIENADRMNHEAQNCFLKTLEEPKGNTLIILVSSKPDFLLPTIFSRCQMIPFFPEQAYRVSKEEQISLQELLPIINAELAVKFQFTKKINLEGNNMNIILKVLQRYFRNILLAKIGITSDPNLRIHPNNPNYTIEKLTYIIRLIESLHRQLAITNASPKLALEILLLEL